LEKIEKTFSNSFPSQVAIYPKWENLTLRKHICAQRSAAHHSVLEEVERYKNNFVFSQIPNLSFQEVEG
jgi:hypothetical protein